MSATREDPEKMPFSPASERNRGPIWAAMASRLPERGALLEIGSGTGQHAVYMAPRCPRLTWLPTDRESVLPGLQARLDREGSPNIRTARRLDVSSDDWPEERFEVGYSANTTHIMSWTEVEAMFAGLSRVLRFGAMFFLYGPFRVRGAHTSPGNEAFDLGLRREDPAMGLRDIVDLESLAQRNHFQLLEPVSLPANNLLLVFTREAGHEG